MESQAQNPYKAPEAEVENAPTGNLAEVFDRFSAWGVLGLSIITFGIYSLYWHISRTKRINDRMEYQIGSVFVNIAIAFWVIAFLGNVGQFLPEPLMILIGLAGIGNLVTYFMWVYKIRAAIHSHVNAEKGTYAWANAFLTIFGSLYLQYKINKIIDNE